jgi:hypothetical protein
MSDCNLCIDQLLEPDPQDDLVIVNNNGSLSFFESSATPVPIGATQMDVTFAALKSSDSYTFNQLAVENTTDPTPFDIQATVISRSKAGFSVLLDTIPDTTNYLLRWEVAITQI